MRRPLLYRDQRGNGPYWRLGRLGRAMAEGSRGRLHCGRRSQLPAPVRRGYSADRTGPRFGTRICFNARSVHRKRAGRFTVSSGSWSSADCISEKQQASKADYYTFYLTSTKKVSIELSSSDRTTSLYLREGAHGRAPLIAISESAVSKSDDSEIEMLLEKGTYTIEAAVNQSDSSAGGTYRLEADTTSSSVYLGTDSGVSPFTVGYAARKYRVSLGQLGTGGCEPNRLGKGAGHCQD